MLIAIKNQLYKLRGIDLSCLFSEGFSCLMKKDSLIFRLTFASVFIVLIIFTFKSVISVEICLFSFYFSDSFFYYIPRFFMSYQYFRRRFE